MHKEWLIGFAAALLLPWQTSCWWDDDDCAPLFPPEGDPPFEYLSDVTLEPSNVSLQAGASMQFEVARWVCCVYPEAAIDEGCVSWSVTPPDAGSIDEKGGFRVSESALPGRQITVTASWPDFVRTAPAVATVTVYDRTLNPLVGYWHERGAISCDDGSESPSVDGFGELVFRADGTFSLTWVPFEIYVDFVGTYAYSADTGTLQMTIQGGNYVPDQTDLIGTVTIAEDGAILLEGMYFGQRQSSSATVQTCGYVLD